MASLDHQHQLLPASPTPAGSLAGDRGTAEKISRRPLEILYEPRSKPDADKDVPPSWRKNNHTVECVFDTSSRQYTDTSSSIEVLLLFTVLDPMPNARGYIGEQDVPGCASFFPTTWASGAHAL